MGTVPIWNKGRESEALHDSTGERLSDEAEHATQAREAAGRRRTSRARSWKFWKRHRKER